MKGKKRMSNYSSFWFDRKSSVDDILGYDLDTDTINDINDIINRINKLKIN